MKPQAKPTATPTVTQMATRTATPTATANGEISTALLARAGVMLKDAGPNTARSEQFADFQSDAPACDNCGSDHRPRRQLLPLPQLRQQHGLQLKTKGLEPTTSRVRVPTNLAASLATRANLAPGQWPGGI